MFFNKLFFILTSIIIASSQITLASTESKTKDTNSIYLIKHVSCKYRKKDKVSYCVDKDNKNING